jgi:two-component system, OmpR family, KDP operon response regulator KdpE
MSSEPSARILIIEDEDGVRRVLTNNLARRGFVVHAAESGQDGLEAELVFHPDLILLDLGLPDLDGFSLIEALRERRHTPIVVLSVRGAEADKVRALDLGADDYLAKPFGVEEMLARVRVALRHASRAARESVFRTGDLVVDLERRAVAVAGKAVHLTPTEYGLLAALVTQPGAVLTDRALLRQVWGAEYGSENHYLHVFMARLRKKLEEDPARPKYIQTDVGVGYRLVEEPVET